MLYFKVKRAGQIVLGAHVATEADREGPDWRELESRNDWRTFEEAKAIAHVAGPGYLAIDNGAHVSPRYDVIKMHKVGDPVSYGFNGDSYPCGEIASISKFPHRLIVTTEGQKFYRRGDSGSWKYQSTWSLMRGHVSTTNPEF
jgi:hypothetical protein